MHSAVKYGIASFMWPITPRYVTLVTDFQQRILTVCATHDVIDVEMFRVYIYTKRLIIHSLIFSYWLIHLVNRDFISLSS